MSKTLEQIGYSILEQRTNHKQTDDEEVEIEFLYDQVHDIRAFLLDREYKKKKRVNAEFYQRKCLDLLCEEIECKGIKSGVKERYVDLSELETYDNIPSILWLGTPDFKVPFRKLTFPNGVGGRFTKKLPSYTYIEDKAIIGGELPTPNMKFIGVVGLCEISNETCNVTDRYPIPANLIHELEGMALRRIMPSASIPRDEKTDTVDNV